MARHHVRVTAAEGVLDIHVPPQWSYDAFGCKEISWQAYYPEGSRPAVLRAGALVEAVCGTTVDFAGELAEPDWGSGTFAAMGLAYGAERFLALDGSGNATSNPTTAVTQAIARGWGLAGYEDVPNANYLAAVEEPTTSGGLFDDVVRELGKWWAVGQDRVLRFVSAPTTPDWILRPGVFSPGTVASDYASAVVVIYLDAATSAYLKVIRVDQAAADKYGYREAPLDATSLGPISTAKAQAIGDGVLARGGSRLGWVNTIEVSAGDLFTPGGVRADLSLLRSHQSVRAFVGYDDVGLVGASYMDLHVGATTFDAATPSKATIAPLGAAPQTLTDALEDIQNAATLRGAA